MKNARLMMVTLIALVAAVGFAQEEADMRQLRQQAVRLGVLGELPEAARADAEVLLNQGEALAERAQALRVESLQAYIDALEAGEVPVVARELAQQAVSAGRLALMRDMASFRDEVQAFTDEYPEARGVLGQLRQGMGRSVMGQSGMGRAGMRHGGMGQGGMGQGGMRQSSMRHGGMGHGGMGHGGFGGGGFGSEFEPQQSRRGGHQQGMTRERGGRGMNRFNNSNDSN